MKKAWSTGTDSERKFNIYVLEDKEFGYEKLELQCKRKLYSSKKGHRLLNDIW